MDFIIPVLIIFAFFIGAFVLITVQVRSIAARRRLPTREQWQQQSPAAPCPKCGASEQRDFGLDDQHDAKRVVACAACGKELFQFVREGGAA